MIFQTISVTLAGESILARTVYRYVWTAGSRYVSIIAFPSVGAKVRAIKREAARQEFNDFMAGGGIVLGSGVQTRDSANMALGEEMTQAIAMLSRLNRQW